MAKSNTLKNGPSKTGNEPGKCRGNNLPKTKSGNSGSKGKKYMTFEMF